MKATVEVIQFVTVEVPDSLLTEDFMEEFRGTFYEFDTREDHLMHIAQLAARGVIYNGGFIEGYGSSKEVGIKFRVDDVYTELEHLIG